VRGEIGGVLVVDDFAHHPTAVRETLRALKARYGDKRRLIAVFEPRSATSRRKIFQKDYLAAFEEADSIYIARPYDQSRIAEADQFSSETLVDDLQAAGKVAELMPSAAEGALKICQVSRPGDLVAVLSNGSFEGMVSLLMQNLPLR